MLKFITRCKVDIEVMRKKYIPKDMMRYMFDSSRKRMSTFLEIDDQALEGTSNRRLHVKGAAEFVLESCSHYLDENGEKKSLDDQMNQLLDNRIKSYANESLRAISFAYKDVNTNECGPNHDEKETPTSKVYNIELSGFTLICIAGIKDIIREEVPEAVVKCNNAGVRVRMITGDKKETAIAIAKECGIMVDGDEN